MAMDSFISVSTTAEIVAMARSDVHLVVTERARVMYLCPLDLCDLIGGYLDSTRGSIIVTVVMATQLNGYTFRRRTWPAETAVRTVLRSIADDYPTRGLYTTAWLSNLEMPLALLEQQPPRCILESVNMAATRLRDLKLDLNTLPLELHEQ
jgi:hypothetical protein